MFGLFKKKEESQKVNFSQIKVDMHSHLLPGIDDGAKDLEMSIELIRQLHALGYEKFITTPHILWEMYPNTSEIIHNKLSIVRERIIQENIPVEIAAAAEYYLDDHVAQLLAKNEPLLTVKDNMVLCEFSLIFPTKGIKEILFEMIMQNYLPIIAHPERYIYLEKNKEFYEELQDMGCLFQLNLLSLTPQYGKTVQHLAQHLIKNEFYSYVGTDLHHEGHIQGLTQLALPQNLQKQLNEGKIKNSLL